MSEVPLYHGTTRPVLKFARVRGQDSFLFFITLGLEFSDTHVYKP